MIQSREDARQLINELKQKGKQFNAWLNTQAYISIMHMKQGEMAKYRDAWEEGYNRGKEYGQDIG